MTTGKVIPGPYTTKSRLLLQCMNVKTIITELFIHFIFSLEFIYHQPSVWHAGYPSNCHYCDVMQFWDKPVQTGARPHHPHEQHCIRDSSTLRLTDSPANQPPHNCRRFFFFSFLSFFFFKFLNKNSDLGDGFALTSPRRDCRAT